MATNIEEDDLVNCPICYELFTNPKYLPCLHTFCGLCLKSYVISQLSGDNKSAKQFPCPVCRQIVQVPDLNISSDSIAELFPVNHLIVSLMDKRQGVSEKSNKDRSCDPCKQSGDSVKATVWCPTCFEALCENCTFYHKKLKQSRHHEIKSIVEIDEENTTAAALDIEEPCSEHFGKVLEVYCVDHKAMCCVICLATKHRKCENISTFDEMVKGEKAESIEKFKTELLEVDKRADKIITNATQNIDMLNKQHDKFAGEVSKVVQVAISKLDTLNSEFLLKFKQERDQHNTALEERKKKIKMFQTDVKKGYQLLQAVCSNGSAKQIFITKEKLKTQLKSHVTLLKQELKDSKNVQLTTHIDKTLRAVSDSLNSVAEIKAERTPDTPLLESLDEFQSTFSDQERTTDEMKDFEVSNLYNIPVPGDITGGAFLPDGKMVFCDYSNKTLKLCDKTGRGITDTKLNYTPWDATYVSDNKVFVSANNRSFIKKYDVSGDSFNEVAEIPCKTSQEGIAYNDGKLIVANESTIDVITLDGKCLTSVQRPQCIYRCYVGVPKQDRFCHNDGDSVVCRLFDGKELYRYSDQKLEGLFGIGCDCYGNVFVCGYNSGNLLAFSEKTKQGKILIDGLDMPFAIGFDKSGDRFFLSDIGSTRSVNVYRIKSK